jgi:serine protease Do
MILSLRQKFSFHRLFLFFLATSFVWVVPEISLAGSAPPSTFADLAEKLGPSVVNVYTTQMVKAPTTPHEFFFNDPQTQEMFKRFFGVPSPFGAPGEQPREMKRTSLGSGIIASQDGYIITNNHVVENADEINVKLSSSEEYRAEVIGRDPKTDLALIKIKAAKDLPALRFGDSDGLRVGDWVLAIGNPFGFEQTVTAGIVSGKGRSLGNGPYENFIQTDASINPGNSGGPLFNMDGEMVGINTAIYSRSGGNIGIGFAIPVNTAKNIIEQLKEHGTVTRGWLGVMIQQMTPELAQQFKLDRPIGALVGEVSPGSPAEKAGIKAGDVIVEYNGRELSQMSMLPTLVAQTPVGSKVKVIVVRKGKKKDFTVEIAKLDEDQVAMGGAEEQLGRSLGLAVQTLTPDLAKSLKLEDTQGVLVTNVEPNSPAAEAGLRPGDLILEINQEPVPDLNAYNGIIKNIEKGSIVSFFLKSKGHTRFVALKFE